MIRKEYFEFLSSDNKTKINCCSWKKLNTKYKGVVQITHGMVEHSERYDDFARFLAENDYIVVANDHLGHGKSIKSKKEYGYFGKKPLELLLNDMNTLRKMSQKDNIPYIMLGHSMGSYLLRCYLSRYSNEIDASIIVGTGYINGFTTTLAKIVCFIEALFKGWHHRSTLLQQLSYDKYYKKFSLDGSDLKNSWLSKDEEIVKKYKSDPKCGFVFTNNGYLGLFQAVSTSCNYKNIDKINKKLPILITSGENDPVGSCSIGVKKVYDLFKKAGIKNTTLKLYKNDRHEILNETDKETVYNDILSWINKNTIK